MQTNPILAQGCRLRGVYQARVVDVVLAASTGPTLTEQDLRLTLVYARLIDAEASGLPHDVIARTILGFELNGEPALSRFAGHLTRARWIASDAHLPWFEGAERQ